MTRSLSKLSSPVSRSLVQEDLRCPPRFGTRRSPDRPTLGGNVTAIAQALGKPLLPHQQYICDVALEIDPETGRLAYDDVTVVGPRQCTGKTELLLPLMTHRCTGYGPALTEWIRAEFGIDVPEPGPQKVLYTAQTADLAREKWRDVHVKRIGASPLAALWSQSPRLRLNSEAMFWANGSVWSPGATTGKTAGTGDTLDMPVIDEMWSKEDNRTELGLRPAMMTRLWRQFFRVSMVPGLSRVVPEKWPYMRQKMTAGRARVEADVRKGTAYFEWSLALDADWRDEDTWWAAMPGLGYTVPVENVRADFDQMPTIDFQAEYLGWWPTGAMPLWQVVSEQTWRDLYDGRAYDDPVAIAVDATPELTAASIGMAAQRPDGDVHVELIDRRPGVNWLLEAILSLNRSHSVCAVGVDRNGPLAGLVRPLTRAAIDQNLDITIVEMNSAEVAAACAAFLNETGELDGTADADEAPTLRRVHHIDQPELTAAIGGAVKHFHGDRWRWDRAHSAADVSPLFAVSLALAAGESQEWVGGRYDIMDSLG